MATLQEENQYVLNLIQSLLGAISPNFRAVSIACETTIILRFLLQKDSKEDREEIEEIEFEFLTQQNRPLTVMTEIVVSNKPIEEVQIPGRLVFLRRESHGRVST